ncbi:hypothetical protein KFE25_005549 [Diacronema lutheri]|uniref:ATP-grasp domain-containing protein n=2 Tax=Diacronema lutheri TaxID=2081491 RepID=A0A8J5XSY5_DIALT|nr:hypothetical protein KFE25_005549 [Diacronema lutheri]
MPRAKEPTGSIVVVDPVSTGANVALEALLRGYAVIALWTLDLPPSFRSHVPICVASHLRFAAEVEERPTLEDTVAALRGALGETELMAVVCGCESGVKVADRVSEAVGLRTNGSAKSDSRRNKKVQQEAVRAAGLRSCREAGGTTWDEVASFVASEPMPVIVKPVESAGSDGVKLCRSTAEAHEHFVKLAGEQRKFGAQGAGILVQEFLRGKEYVVDSVSRDGVHKACMVWLYDKRPLNGAPFVYFNMLPVADQAVINVIVPYTFGVLDALGIRNGPSHGEVMLTESGPCLVEMNCRTHGGDGAWVPLARGLTGGYSQVDATIDAFEPTGAAFEKLPSRPPHPFRAAGQEVLLVSTDEGKVVATPGLDAFKQLRSFVSLETGVHVGSTLERTVDVFTQAGSVILCHSDESVVREDVAAIRQLEAESRVFVLEHHTSILSPSPAVVRARSTSGSADELRRRYEAMNEAINASKLVRKRRHTSLLPLSGLRTFLAEATGYAPAHVADDEPVALSARRSSRNAYAPVMPPPSYGSYRPMSIATSVVIFSVGFAVGVAATLVRSRARS